MINSITIQNFRCFENTSITGFKQVNLFGGKNNAGKTTLLEALYLNSSPRASSVRTHQRLRRESSDFAKAYPEKAWDNFFYNQNKKEHIVISVTDSKSDGRVEFFCDTSVEDFSKIIDHTSNDSDEDLQALSDLLAGRDSARSTLHIEWISSEKHHDVASLLAHSKGVLSRDMIIPDVRQVMMIPSSLPGRSNSALAQEYDKADLAGYADRILQGIKIIDHSIEQLKTLMIGNPAIYLRRENQELMPLSLFGEALSKVVTLILSFVNNRGGVLLIDEIENGIHHTSQREFWRMLFRLADEFQIQVFATTHSLEMLQAFQDVGSEEDNQELSSYFELTRNIRTQQITGIQHNLDTLAYQLERNIGVRGE